MRNIIAFIFFFAILIPFVTVYRITTDVDFLVQVDGGVWWNHWKNELNIAEEINSRQLAKAITAEKYNLACTVSKQLSIQESSALPDLTKISPNTSNEFWNCLFQNFSLGQTANHPEIDKIFNSKKLSSNTREKLISVLINNGLNPNYTIKNDRFHTLFQHRRSIRSTFDPAPSVNLEPSVNPEKPQKKLRVASRFDYSSLRVSEFLILLGHVGQAEKLLKMKAIQPPRYNLLSHLLPDYESVKNMDIWHIQYQSLDEIFDTDSWRSIQVFLLSSKEKKELYKRAISEDAENIEYTLLTMDAF